MSGVAKTLFSPLGGLLGGILPKAPKAPKAPKVPPPAPRISGADASGRGARGKLKRRKGLGSTVLTQGLGKSSASAATGTNILSGVS